MLFLLINLSHLAAIFFEQQQHDEDAAEIKLLKNRISKLEQMQSNQGIKSKYSKRNSVCTDFTWSEQFIYNRNSCTVKNLEKKLIS